MSLHKYWIDFSSLNTNEKTELTNRVDSASFNGLFWDPDFQNATIFLDETFNPASLKIPDICHLTRIDQ